MYIGKDSKTGKTITTTVTAKTLRQLDRKILNLKVDFEANGATVKTVLKVSNLKELAEEWFSYYKTSTSSQNTLNKVRNYLDTYILPKFGEYLPDKITPAEIQVWVNQLAQKSQESVALGKKKSQKGEARDFGAVVKKLSSIFDYGITMGILTNNPVTTINVPKKPQSEKKRIMVLHDQDLVTWLRFLNTLQDTRANRKFKVICNTLLASALRINELLALEIDDLIFQTNEIQVNKTLMRKAGNKELGISGEIICKKTPKTYAANRYVVVPKNILEELKAFHLEMNDYFAKHGLEKSKLIFPTIYGNYTCDRNERTTLEKRLAELGLPTYGFHLFRHTHASLMLNAGVNWKELQVRLGHTSIKTTMDIYAELAPKKIQNAVNLYSKKINELTSLT